MDLSSTNQSTDFSCVLCKSHDNELLSSTDRHGNSLESVVCCDCGLVQHKAIPSNEELTQFYEKDYRLAYNGEVTPSARRVVREWRRGRDRYRWVNHFVKPGDRVFEVGSGIGCNLKPYEMEGCQTEGIEPGEGFCRYSREKLNVPVQQKFLFDVQPQGNQDLALLIHVLEHLPQPIESLKHIRSMLRPGGYLYIEVPNFGAPHASPSKIFHYGHIFNFTAPTLRAVGEAAGFEVAEEITGPKMRILGMVFRRRESFDFEIPTDGYEVAVNGYRRFTPLTYRLQPTVVLERLKDVSIRIGEALTADAKLKKILAKSAVSKTQQVAQAA